MARLVAASLIDVKSDSSRRQACGLVHVQSALSVKSVRSQCANSTGMVIEASRVRVVPPMMNSKARECP